MANLPPCRAGEHRGRLPRSSPTASRSKTLSRAHVTASCARVSGEFGRWTVSATDELTGTGFGNDVVGLVAELGGESPVGGKHLGRRKNLLLVAGRMRRNLRRLVAFKSVALHVGAYLLASRTGGVQVLLRVALDLRRAAAAGLDLVAEIAQSEHQFRLIDGRGELLRLEEAPWLESARRCRRRARS